jgi:hypothetical protein
MGLLRHHPSIGKLRLATGAQPRPLARMPLMVDMTTIALSGFRLRLAPRWSPLEQIPGVDPGRLIAPRACGRRRGKYFRG